jgi:PAS domain S-box-containing protein
MSDSNSESPLSSSGARVSSQPGFASPDFRLGFESAPDRYLLLLPNYPVFTIVAATDAYLEATLKSREELVGRGLFEAFPENPKDKTASGIDNVRESLIYVLRQRSAHVMPVQKYDIALPDGENAGFEERYWAPSNSPVFTEDGALAYIIHRVEDVTELVRSQDRPVAPAEHKQSELLVRDRLLEESRRRTIEREEAERLVAERVRFTALSADIGVALTRLRDADEMLQACAEALVTHLHVAFARVWILDTETKILELRASAGLYTHLNGQHARIPVGAFKIGWIAQEKKPHLTNDVLNDPRIGDREWARREGMVAFAGYPLIVDDCLIGVMGLFARSPLQKGTLAVLGSAADSIAVGIERKRSEDARARQALVLAQSHAELAQQWQTFDTVLSNTLDHAYALDPDGRFIYANRALLKRLQKSRAEVLGKSFPDLGYPPELAARLLQQIRDVVETKKPVRDVTPITLPNRETRYYDYIFVPVISAEGAAEAVAGTTRDVTEQRAREEELKKANRELEEFAYVASHDLQEPLRMINIYTQLIMKGLPKDESKLKKYGEIVEASVVRMQALLTDLLSYARTGERDEIKPAIADLSISLAEALVPLRSRIEETNAIITAAPLPKVWGDVAQLSHVFQNLLANSIKYSKAGVPPEIGIQVEPQGDHWVVALRDNGIGFAQEYAERIFGLFKRLHKDEYAGTGVGLAICQRIVERHGGRIWAQGVPGQGATFFISLPRVEDAAKA